MGHRTKYRIQKKGLQPEQFNSLQPYICIANFVTMIVITLGIFNRRLGFRLKDSDHLLPTVLMQRGK